MEQALLRPAVPADLEALTALWTAAFSDPAALVRRMLTQGGLLSRATVAELEGRAVSAMYAFPGLCLCGRPAAYLYALSTLPQYRGRGLGAAVLDSLARACFQAGAELVCLSPADAGLSHWYQGLGFAPLCTMEDAPVPLTDAVPGVCVPVTQTQYAALRCPQPGLTPELLLAQGILLEAEGGGFFRLELPAGAAFACACPTKDGLWILELLCPPEVRPSALQTLARHFHTRQLCLRRPGGSAIALLARSAQNDLPTPPPDFCFPFLLD